MKKKYYHYFVSFVFSNASGMPDLGMALYSSISKIRSYDDILKMALNLEKEFNGSHLVILNYRLMRKSLF